MINQDGALLERDLGKTTTQTATAMTEFDPDEGWSVDGLSADGDNPHVVHLQK